MTKFDLQKFKYLCQQNQNFVRNYKFYIVCLFRYIFNVIYHNINMTIENLPTTEILISVFFILVTLFVFKNIIRPYRQFMFYKKSLTQNYRALIDTFSILGMNPMKRIHQGEQKYNDAQIFTKKQGIKYQVQLWKIGPDILLSLSDPELVKEFYQKSREGYYVKAFKFPALATGLQIIGDGLLFSEGCLWRKKKKILSNIFNFDFINSKMQAISLIAEKNYNIIQALPQNKDKQIVTIQLTNLFHHIFGEVISMIFFGNITLEKLQGQQISNYVNSLFMRNVKRSTTPYAFIMGNRILKLNLRQVDKDVKRRNQQFRSYSKKVIQQIIKQSRQQQLKQSKQESIKQKGLIWWMIKQNLLSQQHSDQKYDKQQLINQIITFFIGGTESTANVLTSLIYSLSKYPQMLKKIKDQINNILGDRNINDITLQQLKKFHFVENVLKESLRMFPPVANIFIRQVAKDHYLGKIPMKKGIQVLVKILANQYRPQFYDNPLQFNPDRWDTIDQSKAQTYSYFPFSYGQRVCIGQQLALMQAKIALICLLKRYKEITLQKPDYVLQERLTYGPERMKVYFKKN